jgi:hypothetical protein
MIHFITLECVQLATLKPIVMKFRNLFIATLLISTQFSFSQEDKTTVIDSTAAIAVPVLTPEQIKIQEEKAQKEIELAKK